MCLSGSPGNAERSGLCLSGRNRSIIISSNFVILVSASLRLVFYDCRSHVSGVNSLFLSLNSVSGSHVFSHS